MARRSDPIELPGYRVDPVLMRSAAGQTRAATLHKLVTVPGVISALHVAGEDDFHLHVAVESSQALRDIILQHVTVHPVVRPTETQPVFEARDGVEVLA